VAAHLALSGRLDNGGRHPSRVATHLALFHPFTLGLSKYKLLVEEALDGSLRIRALRALLDTFIQFAPCLAQRFI
jgi:hypothetical protein